MNDNQSTSQLKRTLHRQPTFAEYGIIPAQHRDIIMLVTEDRLYRFEVGKGQRISLGPGQNDVMEVPELGEGRLFFEIAGGKLHVTGENIEGLLECDVEKDATLSAPICEYPKMSVRWAGNLGAAKETLKLFRNCEVRIGRSRKNDVILRNKFVSRSHLVIRRDEGGITAEDLDSSNGTYLNGKRIQKASLHSGDVLDILHIRIRLLNDELHFENVGDEMEMDAGHVHFQRADFSN